MIELENNLPSWLSEDAPENETPADVLDIDDEPEASNALDWLASLRRKEQRKLPSTEPEHVPLSLRETDEVPEIIPFPAPDKELPDSILSEVDAEDALPSWLIEDVENVSEDIPAWLTEEIETPTQTQNKIITPSAQAVVAVEEKPKVDITGIDDLLRYYEGRIRAKVELDETITSLHKLKQTCQGLHLAAIYRLIGDGQMRKGQLTEAMAAYRKALTLL